MADKGKIIIDIQVQGNGGVEVEKVTKSLQELREETLYTEKDLKKVISQLKAARAEVDVDAEAYENLTQEIERYNSVLKVAGMETKTQANNLELVSSKIELFRKRNLNTESEIRNAISLLQRQKESAVIGSEAYEKLSREIEHYNAMLTQASSKIPRNTAAQVKNTKAVKSATKAKKNLSDRTGLAGAATVELGRTISDANYGFTAMANNISQLSTLFATLVFKEKGVANAGKAMWAALKGPLGFIVAFQVIVALFEKLSLSARDAASEVNSLADAMARVETNIKETLIEIDIYENAKKGTIAWKNALEELRKKGFDETKESIQDFYDRYTEYETASARLAEAHKNEEKALSDLQQTKDEIRLQEEKIAELKENGGWGEAEVSIYYWLFGSDEGDVEKGLKKLKEVEEKFEEAKKRKLEAEKAVKNTQSAKKEAEDILNFANSVKEAERDLAIVREESEIEKIKLRKKYALEDIDIELRTYERKMELAKLEEGADIERIDNLIKFARRSADEYKGIISETFDYQMKNTESLSKKTVEAAKLFVSEIRNIQRELLRRATSDEIELIELKKRFALQDIQIALEAYKIKTRLNSSLTQQQKDDAIAAAESQASIYSGLVSRMYNTEISNAEGVRAAEEIMTWAKKAAKGASEIFLEVDPAELLNQRPRNRSCMLRKHHHS